MRPTLTTITRKFSFWRISAVAGGVFVMVFIISGVTVPFAFADPITDMNRSIDEKKDEIDDLSKKLQLYQKKIQEAKKDARTLQGQISILEDEIEKNSIDLEITEKQIQKTNLEIQKISLAIDEMEKSIDTKKHQLAEYVRIIHQQDHVGYLEVMLLHDSFSEFFDQYAYIQNIHNKVQFTLTQLKNIKADLVIQKETLNDKKSREEELKAELEVKRGEMVAKTNEKETLLRETRRSEVRFQSYVEELKKEQVAINNEIVTMEKKIRQELERREKEERFRRLGSVRLDWPVSNRGITAYFYDPEYPYRHVFEHPAIDIRAAQGTPVRVAESGYVARTKNGGKKGYSYIMVIHSEGISTVYGHISAINVKADQYVEKGDVIALSGGMPGTPGAGPLTTGPHLHFEVRKNGIPVNPLDYLP